MKFVTDTVRRIRCDIPGALGITVESLGKDAIVIRCTDPDCKFSMCLDEASLVADAIIKAIKDVRQ